MWFEKNTIVICVENFNFISISTVTRIRFHAQLSQTHREIILLVELCAYGNKIANVGRIPAVFVKK